MMDAGILRWLWLVWGLFVAVMLVSEVRRRKRAGPVLLDLGVPEERVEMGLAGRKPRLILGVLQVSFGLIQILSPKFRTPGFVFLAWGSLSLVAAGIPRHIQLRQTGVLGRKLFRWRDTEDYAITPKGNLTLKLWDSGWTYSIANVHPPKRQKVASLLASKAGFRHGV
jgi:hypothetical protein